MGARIERVIARMAAWRYSPIWTCRVFSRALDLGGGRVLNQHFLLDMDTPCVLGYYRYIPAVRVWNGPLMGSMRRLTAK